MLPRPRTLAAGFVPPCLPMKAPKPPSGALWLHEIKHDGRHMTKQKPLLFPSVPNAPAYLRRMPTKAEMPADLIVVHNSVRGKPRLGSNGFRAWLARPAARYVRCDCKWAAHLDVHYRVEQDGS